MSKEEEYNNPLTKSQQRYIKDRMNRFLEEMPNAGFFQQHPEYEENYLKDIDLTELDDPLGKE